jgi:uncharacterized membrane protein HdeD (DUF308 family)
MFTKLGWGLLGEILLLATALLLMSAFALGSFSSAYLMALLVLAVGVLGFLVYRRVKRRA